MQLCEVAYLAGLVNGEGTFTSSGRRPAFRVEMTDQDIIERLQAMTGLGTIYMPALRQEHHKQSWVWSVGKRSDIAHLARLLLPLLSPEKTVDAKHILFLCQAEPLDG